MLVVPCVGGDMLASSTERYCCAGAVFSSALGCADAPGSTIAFVGRAISYVIFDCPWGEGDVVTGAVSGANPCELGVCERTVLGFVLSLV